MIKHRLACFYLSWLSFWRLPETDSTRRTQTKAHAHKVHIVKNVWIVVLGLLAIIGQAALIVFSLVFLIFVSLMFLDEV